MTAGFIESVVPRELLLLMFAAWGLSAGSFANVLITRLPGGFLLARPRRSACTSCFRRLGWIENIPVLSYLVLRGKCRSCGAAIGPLHPLVELMSGALFVACFLRWGVSIKTLAMAWLAVSLVAMVFIDLKHRIIPDEISLGGIVVGLAAAALEGWGSFGSAALGAACGAGFFWALATGYEKITGREGLGFGDVKLLGAIGAFLGLQGVVGTILVSSVVGSIVGLALMATRRGNLQSAVPYGPFLALGAFTMMFWGDLLMAWLYPLS